MAPQNDVGRQLAHKMHRVGVEVQAASKVSVQRAAAGMKRRVERSLQTVVPDLNMSGVGKSGARIGVRVHDVRATGSKATALLLATGPVHLIERETMPHDVDPTPRSANAVEALQLPDGGIRHSVPHPGTRGQAPWEKGIEASTPPAVKELRKSMRDAVVRGVRA